MYIKVVNELGPNQRTQIWIHQRSLQEIYHLRTAGGVRGFVHRYQTAYGELDHLGVKHTQQESADNLLKNFLCESTTSLVELIRASYKNSKEPFKDTCEHLLNYYHEQQWSNNQALTLHPTARHRHVQNTVIEQMSCEDDRMAAAVGQQRSEDLRILDTWWKGATIEEQEVLRQMRNKIKLRLQTRKEYPVSSPNTQQKQLPQQYRVGQTIQGENVVDSIAHAQQSLALGIEDDTDDDEDHAVAQLGIIESTMRDVFGGMARTERTEHVRCHMEYVDRLANFSHSQAQAYTTADSGADTNVLGKEWLIVSSDPIRKVNLVGFDAAHARKKGLSIVTADTIARTADGNEIILRAHQSVSNPSTSTTQLSEVQSRHAGHIVDSVHKDHLLTIDGDKVHNPCIYTIPR